MGGLRCLCVWGGGVRGGAGGSGSGWFMWVLLGLDVMGAAVWSMAPRVIPALGQLIFSVRDRPMLAFGVFLMVSITAYLPMHLAFGDTSWLEPGRFPLPIQTSRILLYSAYFFAGVGAGATSLKLGLLAEDGEFARRWPVWLA